MNLSPSIDLDKYPIHQLDSSKGLEMVDRFRSELKTTGVLTLAGFLRRSVVEECVVQLSPIIEKESFVHSREHNIYFDDHLDKVAANASVIARMHTTSLTVCGDQITSSVLWDLYQWQPMIDFIAAIVGKYRLYPMDDPLAGLNIKSMRNGDVTNWHFDRSEFTITLLLQQPISGGVFQVRRNLRSDGDPNYSGVGELLEGKDKNVRSFDLEPGTLTVFQGKHSAHRVSPVSGRRKRIVAVFSYFDSPGVRFSDEDRVQFYGRSHAIN